MQTNPKLIQFVDTPFTVTYSASGQGSVRWPPGNDSVLSIDGYTQVSLEIGPAPHTTSFDVYMGKISGSTLSSIVGVNLPVGATIRTFPVIAPEMSIFLHGTANSTDKVQLWVYLRP